MNTKKEIIPCIFASLQGLERKLSIMKSAKNTDNLSHNIGQQEKVLKEMRCVANKIQTSFARNRNTETQNLLKVYYGLNNLVRPEINHSISSSKFKKVEKVH